MMQNLGSTAQAAFIGENPMLRLCLHKDAAIRVCSALGSGDAGSTGIHRFSHRGTESLVRMVSPGSFRWDHRFYPDALVPVARTSDTGNRIDGQTAQAYWVDIWIPPNAAPKVYQGVARLSGNGPPQIVTIKVNVLPTVIPDGDAVTLDNNSYGTSWLIAQYPKTLARLAAGQGGEDDLFRLIHQHHRIFYDHRGTFHQLGYGHAGKVGPEFAPELTGSGRENTLRAGPVSTNITGLCWMALPSGNRVAARIRFHSCICRSTPSGPLLFCGGVNRDTKLNLSM